MGEKTIVLDLDLARESEIGLAATVALALYNAGVVDGCWRFRLEKVRQPAGGMALLEIPKALLDSLEAEAAETGMTVCLTATRHICFGQRDTADRKLRATKADERAKARAAKSKGKKEKNP